MPDIQTAFILGGYIHRTVSLRFPIKQNILKLLVPFTADFFRLGRKSALKVYSLRCLTTQTLSRALRRLGGPRGALRLECTSSARGLAKARQLLLKLKPCLLVKVQLLRNSAGGASGVWQGAWNVRPGLRTVRRLPVPGRSSAPGSKARCEV
ncbi:hypothetical protein NDU88_004570 [Pleurodeles waltl]|uniref:Uncharacterized protein n=1 Tax=Pleurodeles waltl TaxID=8319 RepID=A0AAV7NJV1_PLEWA|nr:hypothetical protein NDU88_004570 [Pleurodeles waltl]